MFTLLTSFLLPLFYLQMGTFGSARCASYCNAKRPDPFCHCSGIPGDRLVLHPRRALLCINLQILHSRRACAPHAARSGGDSRQCNHSQNPGLNATPPGPIVCLHSSVIQPALSNLGGARRVSHQQPRGTLPASVQAAAKPQGAHPSHLQGKAV